MLFIEPRERAIVIPGRRRESEIDVMEGQSRRRTGTKSQTEWRCAGLPEAPSTPAGGSEFPSTYPFGRTPLLL